MKGEIDGSGVLVSKFSAPLLGEINKQVENQYDIEDLSNTSYQLDLIDFY